MNSYATITNAIVKLLEQGETIPWNKPWEGGKAGAPKNLDSQNEYHGINVFMLSMYAAAKGYHSPYWLTYKQAQGLGGHVKAGEHGCPVIKALVFQAKGEDGEVDTESERKVGIKHYTVFNAEQCALPETLQPYLNPQDTPGHTWDPLAACETVVAAMPQAPELTESTDGRAFYRPSTDTVSMPDRKSFPAPAGYYSTLFHELGHSTGHERRLNRTGITAISPFGTPDYSKEELVAEMTAAFLCGVTGIENAATRNNSAAYVQGWLTVLRKETRWLIQAAAQAQKAADFILGKRVGEHPAVPVPAEPAPVKVAVNTPPALCKQAVRETDSLTVFIAKAGGINPDYNRGPWAHEVRMIREGGKGLPPGTLNRRARLTTEEMAARCAEWGYITDGNDIEELFYALARDVEAAAVGDKVGRVYSTRGQETLGVTLAWERYNHNLEEAA
jgi:antirestriction protein ArdC